MGIRIRMGAAALALTAAAWAGAAGAAPAVGTTLDAFSLPDQLGIERSLERLTAKGPLILYFIGSECPITNRYVEELNRLAETYREQGVQVVGVNSNYFEAPADIARHHREFAVAFPVLRDASAHLAAQVGADRTGLACLIDREGVIRYAGRVDDRHGYTYQRDEGRRADLEEALKDVLAGRPVRVAETEVKGCIIPEPDDAAAAEPAPVTYAADIAHIVQENCTVCHRDGGIGPMAFDGYGRTKAWGEMIQEVVLDGRMPPWHADARYGAFKNDRRLADDDINKIVAWIEQGMPEGDPAQLPAPKEYPDGWAIGDPDMVITLPEPVDVPATGVMPYIYFSQESEFAEDKWVQAVEARPGAPGVVHHIIVFLQFPKPETAANEGSGDSGEEGGERRRRRRGGSFDHDGWLVAWAPGAQPQQFAPGTALKVPAGSKFIWQMHYTTNGKPAQDRSQVAIRFADGPPDHEWLMGAAINTDFVIPAGADHHEVKSDFTFPLDGRIISLMPHMHLRGKSFKYDLLYPDGREETILWVPRYDFNWQTVYELEAPLDVPKGTKMLCTAHFDNSAENPANPDPTVDVGWGEQSWEEMMIGFFGVSFDDPRRQQTAAHPPGG